MLIGLIGVAGAPQARGADGPRIRVVLYHDFTVVLHADGQVAPVAGQQARLAATPDTGLRAAHEPLMRTNREKQFPSNGAARMAGLHTKRKLTNVK